ncbi:hypothetical protein HY988_02270 [Candidatus Micrarchaeota archaeon]|nr:hypothetical protein [Candidatus Micrarchaeota archaeon]
MERSIRSSGIPQFEQGILLSTIERAFKAKDLDNPATTTILYLCGFRMDYRLDGDRWVWKPPSAQFLSRLAQALNTLPAEPLAVVLSAFYNLTQKPWAESRNWRTCSLIDAMLKVAPLLLEQAEDPDPLSLALSLTKFLHGSRIYPEQFLRTVAFLLRFSDCDSEHMLALLNRLDNSPITHPDLPNLRAMHNLGLSFARSLGWKGPSASECLNLGYGVHELGEERTTYLMDTFGITYFARFERGLLRYLAEKSLLHYDLSKPLVLDITTGDDPRGSFYTSSDSLSPSPRYRFIVIEVGSRKELQERVFSILDQYGPIHRLVFSVHGISEAMFLANNDEGEVISSNLTELDVLGNGLDPSCLILLNSCLTGSGRNPIAGSIANRWQRPVVAPLDSFSSSQFVRTSNQTIIGMSYGGVSDEVASRRFEPQ